MSHKGELVAERPVPGTPRPYEFPHTVRTTLANGLEVIVTPMAERQLIAASLAIRSGAGRPCVVGSSVRGLGGRGEGTGILTGT